jgi:hypothetical protein
VYIGHGTAREASSLYIGRSVFGARVDGDKGGPWCSIAASAVYYTQAPCPEPWGAWVRQERVRWCGTLSTPIYFFQHLRPNYSWDEPTSYTAAARRRPSSMLGLACRASPHNGLFMPMQHENSCGVTCLTGARVGPRRVYRRTAGASKEYIKSKIKKHACSPADSL